jgi:hypothetical protein
MIPVIAVILKVLAVLLLLVLGFFAVQGFISAVQSWAGGGPASPFAPPPQPVTGFVPRLLSLLQPLLTLVMALLFPALIWGFADQFQASREIEYNTRVGNAAVPAYTADEKAEEGPEAE